MTSPTPPSNVPSKKPENLPMPKKEHENDEVPGGVFLVSYPKIIYLYPTFVMALLAALCLQFSRDPLNPDNRFSTVISVLFLGLMAVNMVILAFDFPRTTSLTLFFFAAALLLGFWLLITFQPHLLPVLAELVAKFRPVANATFYWAITGILGAIFITVMIMVRFDYWEVRPNELLHHHGFLSNLERLSAPNLRIDKEINDIFEYMLLRSGRLILQASNERRAIVLDNVPHINKKEEAITRMLGALQVQVREGPNR